MNIPIKLKPSLEKASTATPDISPMLKYEDLSENSIDHLVKKVENLGINSADLEGLEDQYDSPIRPSLSLSKPKDIISHVSNHEQLLLSDSSLDKAVDKAD